MPLSDVSYDAYIEGLRKKEYPSLLSKNLACLPKLSDNCTETTYLDHAGTTLYANSVIDAVHHDLKQNLYGNPHSDSPASWLSTSCVEQARHAVLEFFNADPKDFDVVFTANATAAIKLVADCFREQKFWYGYHKDAHSSLVGVREWASLGSRCFNSNQDVNQWFEMQTTQTPALKLFAYPAQSNMTGYRLPYSWCKHARISQLNTYILLDAASCLTSGQLDLGNVDAAPDFISLSFYKIFGYPDLGCLIVRKSAFDVLSQKRYFGGGTVDLVTVMDDAFHQVKRQTVHDFLEDGTLPFHNIVALKHALSIHPKIFGSRGQISRHTAYISAWLFNELSSLQHYNNSPVIEIYKDENAIYGDASTQGPIISFNILRSDGSYVGKSHVEKLAIACGFQLRTGGVCNPGGIASMLQLRSWELRRNFAEGVRCGDDIDIIATKPTGIVRISLGPMSTISDALRFSNFVKSHFIYHCNRLNPQTSSLVTNIMPVEGCLPISTECNAAFEVWHHQWCIVDLSTGSKVSADLSLIPVDIDVEKEELIINEDIRLSLWEEPELSLGSEPSTNTQKVFNTYDNENVNQKLSKIVGRRCNLARFRRQDLRSSSEAMTCVIATCLQKCTDEAGLRNHYGIHAKSFLNDYPLEARRKMPKKEWKETFVKWRDEWAVRSPRQSSKHSSKNSAFTKSVEVHVRSSNELSS